MTYKPLALFLLFHIAGFALLTTMVGGGGQAAAAEPAEWRAEKGGVLTYGRKDDWSVKLDCIEAGGTIPLLAANRPYNHRVALKSAGARTWAAGRAVKVSLQLGEEVLEDATILAVHDQIMLGPLESEQVVSALHSGRDVGVVISANRPGVGPVKEQLALPAAGVSGPAARQDRACRST